MDGLEGPLGGVENGQSRKVVWGLARYVNRLYKPKPTATADGGGPTNRSAVLKCFNRLIVALPRSIFRKGSLLWHILSARIFQ